MDLSLLAILKEKLATATEFQDVLDYFLTNFGEKQEFIALGKQTHHEFLETVIAQIGAQLFKTQAIVISDILLTQIDEAQFIHGACKINGNLANVIYFDDVQLGLVCIYASLPAPMTHLMRFSTRHLPRPGKPSLN
jgi:hypothetical protein